MKFEWQVCSIMKTVSFFTVLLRYLLAITGIILLKDRVGTVKFINENGKMVSAVNKWQWFHISF